jgi:ribokinase
VTGLTARRPRICMVGSANTDLVARVPYYPEIGSCLTGSAFAIFFGGKGSNQAVTAARLGADVAVIVRLGDDAFGRDHLANYARERIDISHVVIDPVLHSGVALIIVEDRTGRNTIAYTPNANGALSPADVRAGAGAIQAADALVTQLEVPVEATLEAFRIARATGERRPRIILNAAPFPLVPQPDELLSSVDLLIVNEEEAAHFAGRAVADVDQAMAAAVELAARSQAVAVTLGAAGVVICEAGVEPAHVPAREVRAVDTTGAGDAFVGSMAYLLAAGATLAEAAPRAVEIATRTVLRRGAQSSFPYRDEVADLLETAPGS